MQILVTKIYLDMFLCILNENVDMHSELIKTHKRHLAKHDVLMIDNSESSK